MLSQACRWQRDGILSTWTIMKIKPQPDASPRRKIATAYARQVILEPQDPVNIVEFGKVNHHGE